MPTERCTHCGAPIPRRRPLTERESRLVAFIAEYTGAHGCAPTLHEIATRFRWSSVATVHEHLTRLEQKGAIRREVRRSRGIIVLAAQDIS